VTQQGDIGIDETCEVIYYIAVNEQWIKDVSTLKRRICN